MVQSYCGYPVKLLGTAIACGWIEVEAIQLACETVLTASYGYEMVFTH